MRAAAVVLLAAGLFFICWAMFSYLASPPDQEAEGFRGIAWAANIRDLPDMKLIGEEKDQKFYVREGETVELHGVLMDKVVYGFYKGRFYNVMIYFSSMPSFTKVREQLSREYGSPFRPDESGRKFFWSSGKVNTLLTYNDTLSQGRISHFFQPIEAEIEKDEKAGEGQ
jgi:hypothetical protein